MLRATTFKPEGRYIGHCGLYPLFGPRGSAAGEGTFIVATVEVGNAVSIRVLEKLGFAVIGSERGSTFLLSF